MQQTVEGYILEVMSAVGCPVTVYEILNIAEIPLDARTRSVYQKGMRRLRQKRLVESLGFRNRQRLYQINLEQQREGAYTKH